MWSLKDKRTKWKHLSLICRESSAHAKMKWIIVLGVGAQIAWFGGWPRGLLNDKNNANLESVLVMKGSLRLNCRPKIEIAFVLFYDRKLLKITKKSLARKIT